MIPIITNDAGNTDNTDGDNESRTMSAEPLDINAIRARLEAKGGPQVWRSLESVAETPEFQEYLHREFPTNASEWIDPVGRRVVPQADERVDGARRRHRVHGAARPNSSSPTCASPRKKSRAGRSSSRPR